MRCIIEGLLQRCEPLARDEPAPKASARDANRR
jgi:hypothetical protein